MVFHPKIDLHCKHFVCRSQDYYMRVLSRGSSKNCVDKNLDVFDRMREINIHMFGILLITKIPTYLLIYLILSA